MQYGLKTHTSFLGFKVSMLFTPKLKKILIDHAHVGDGVVGTFTQQTPHSSQVIKLIKQAWNLRLHDQL